MASNKRRKTDFPPTKSQLSAFAARKAFKSPKHDRSQTDNCLVPEKSEVVTTVENRALMSVGSSTPALAEINRCPRNEIPELITVLPGSGVLDENQLSITECCAEAPVVHSERPPTVFSTFAPNSDNLEELEDRSVSLKLAPGERLVILGQYDLLVKRGEVTLLGSIFRPSNKLWRVFAPSTHSLPVIRCSGTISNVAEICLYQCQSGLESLSSLSPLFRKLWNNHCGVLGLGSDEISQKLEPSTFQILFSSNDGPQKAYLQPLISPPEWNALIAKFSESSPSRTFVTMVCGPKSAGKSTFAKLLVNRFLSISELSNNPCDQFRASGIALIDLDPGQPEYSPPGQVSLIHIKEQNLGPPFSHPVPGSESTVVRTHSLGAISPSIDPSLYMACALDLFAHYRDLLSRAPGCPLVINTPGWILGTGLEILVDLIRKFNPSEVIYMSEEGPLDVIEALREAAKSIPLFTIPSQSTEYMTRTIAQLRTMQYMSYFHLSPEAKKNTAWNEKPLISIPPWEIRYSGKSSGILGILCYGERPPADLLSHAINGSLVSVVVIDDAAAIPGWLSGHSPADQMKANIDHQWPVMYKKVRAIHDEYHQSQNLNRPLIIRSAKENLPYFNPENVFSLDPSSSHSIGLALIRGINVTRQRLQVLTPISPSIIEEIHEAGKSIVLVSGKIDTPGWAYTEWLHQKTALEKLVEKYGDDDVCVTADVTDDVFNYPDTKMLREEFEDAPWIEVLQGSEGRGRGSRVWRVRRDLGRTSSDGAE